MGRLSFTEQCQPQNCANSSSMAVTPAYDLAGDMASLLEQDYGLIGFTISYAYNSAAELSGVTSSYTSNGHPPTLLSNAAYNAPGELTADSLGNGLNETFAYNNRLWMSSVSTGTVYSLGLTYYPDGSLHTANDSVNGNATYTYDNLNRLSTMSATGNTCTGLSWSYAAWGNRNQQSVTGGTCPSFNISANSNNQLPGPPYTYDADGNTTHDAGNSYTYDAEGRMLTVDGGSGNGGGTYVYDALGRRIETTRGSTGLVYLHDPAGRTIMVVSTGGVDEREEVYAGSRQLVMYANNTAYFFDSDQVGTNRVRSNMSGTTNQTCTSLPFGDGQQCTSGTMLGRYAGYDRDSEYGLAHSNSRYYAPALGRFMTPDPAWKVFANPAYSQSWNMYTYTLDNPATLTDPSGFNCDAIEVDLGTCTVYTTVTVNGSGGVSVASDSGESISAYGLGNRLLTQIPGNAYVVSPTFQQPPQTPGKQNIFSCAAGIGDKYSIAGGLHALGIGTSGLGGFITDALGGNAFSGATNLISSLGSGSAGGHNVFYNMAQGVVAGPGQGVLPPGINGPWGASASGLATDAIAKTAWSSITGAGQTLTTLGGEASLASTAITAAEFASGVAEAKYAYDFLTYAGGAAACAVGLAH